MKGRVQKKCPGTQVGRCVICLFRRPCRAVGEGVKEGMEGQARKVQVEGV